MLNKRGSGPVPKLSRRTVTMEDVIEAVRGLRIVDESDATENMQQLVR